MSSRSQINNMSKKEILHALAHQQNQDMAMMNRLFIALAKAAKVDISELAKNFVDQEGNKEFAEKLNAEIDAMVQKQNQAPSEEEKTPSES